MNKEMKEWIKANFPQKAERIIKGSLPEKRIREAGIEFIFQNLVKREAVVITTAF